jgi:hypothetical protein
MDCGTLPVTEAKKANKRAKTSTLKALNSVPEGWSF